MFRSVGLEEPVEFGVIGGTGVYNIEGFENVVEIEVDTPFGKPADVIRVGDIEGVRVAFLPRHGRGHKHLPTEIPFRANIYALKMIGVRYLLSVSVCGSLREEFKPLDVVIVDQFLNFTRHREETFFGNGCVAHTSFGDPVCSSFSDLVFEACSGAADPSVSVHRGGTYVCIEGPAFSTKAESNMYRMLGGSVIGMTAIPECKLAREAEMSYSIVALITDYDCWHPDHDGVTVELVIQNLKQCAVTAQKMVKECIRRVGEVKPASQAHDALKFSILTPRESLDSDTVNRLEAIIGKYITPSDE